jgi:hypothetical protein
MKPFRTNLMPRDMAGNVWCSIRTAGLSASPKKPLRFQAELDRFDDFYEFQKNTEAHHHANLRGSVDIWSSKWEHLEILLRSRWPVFRRETDKRCVIEMRLMVGGLDVMHTALPEA